MTENNSSDKYIGKLLGERYQILDIIGQGGMAIVYRALDTRLSRNVAVKIMRDELSDDEEFKSRFASESHAIAMLSHPNIVAVYDVSHNDDIEYIVMELINGITLRQYLNRKGKIEWKEVLHFSKQIAAALSHAHQHGIIHRDIKPQNIMLLKDGTIKVADFGIAALENEINSSDGQAIGSLNYLSPEQLKGEYTDGKCDIYSLGVTMYEMLCGTKPYNAENPSDLLSKQMNGELTPIYQLVDDVPDEFIEIVRKSMDPDPEARYLTAQELVEDLDAFTVDFLKADVQKEIEKPSILNVIHEKETKKTRVKNKIKRNRISASVGALGLISLIVLCFAGIWNFWLKDIFSAAERVVLPDFTGYKYEDVSSDSRLTSLFNFIPNYVVDTSTVGGTILSQEPSAGRSLMINKDGINITLNISTGYVLTDVPDVIGLNYREANLKLTNAGFLVELNNISSDEIPKDEVISISPNVGEQISSGSTVYVYVSGGKEISYIKMPNVIGLTEDAAINKLVNSNLVYSSSVRQASDYEAGTVISQSTPAFADVQERTNITITVSTGPEEAFVVPTPEISY